MTRPAGDDGWWRSLLQRCRFPDPGAGPVTLAVSGGPDSMALMVLARGAGLDATVVHVDHGLRPGSGAEADMVAEAARSLGYGFRSVAVQVEPGPDLEARARRERYRALPAGSLTGHTMDDQAESVLLNVLRGAAFDGLSGMRSGLDGKAAGWGVRRPLLGLRRTETEEVCARSSIEPVVDPSNSDGRFRRNRVRTEVLPLLGRVAERDLVPVLARQAVLMAEDADLLEELAAALDPTDVRALRLAPPPLARRALRRWLRSSATGAGEERHPPSAADVARVMEVVSGRYLACQIAGGRRVFRRSGRLNVETDRGVR